MKKKVTMSWSGGKDSALALFEIQESQEFEVVNLHTIIGAETKRVGMHGIPEELIEKQAYEIGLPLRKLYLPTSEFHEAYEENITRFYRECQKENICDVAFGDIFLEDLRVYRDRLLSASGLTGVYPLWKRSTHVLLADFLKLGFKTLVCSANQKYFKSQQMGVTIDDQFLTNLDPEVDLCGENGEFHTFVYDGPIFNRPIEFVLGAVVKKKYNYSSRLDDGAAEKHETSFWFQDIL